MANKYDVILADPPWTYEGIQDKWGAAAKFYKLMPTEDIYRLPILDLLTDKGVLFLWATGPKLDLAVNAISEWGLWYRGVAFVWVKTSKEGLPWRARGVRPSIVKPLTEFVLVGSPVKKGRPMLLSDESVVQTVFARVQEHSAKPAEVSERIESLYPNAKRLELFARSPRKGWDSWGDEAPEVSRVKLAI
jgi:N6-adenosine-specific RNA methylase IME4